MSNPWDWWQNALYGIRGELERGKPKQGFFRNRQKPVAIWYDESGALLCLDGHYQIEHADEIDDLFGFCCRYPIPHEIYESVVAGEPWPEEFLENLTIAEVNADVPWTRELALSKLEAKQAKLAAKQAKARK